MYFHKIPLLRLYHTLKYLRFKQIYYRLYYTARDILFKKEYQKTLAKIPSPLLWDNYLKDAESLQNRNIFIFLNLSKNFKKNIDWNSMKFGKLWAYHLNYFDYLSQPSISEQQGTALIRDYVAKDDVLKIGKEPYPISLRGTNWIKFLSQFKIKDQKINQTLYNHYQILLNNLEYHLLGNHLLENGISLLFGAHYFKDNTLYLRANKILKEELNEQILKDGGHFELSPMYHQVLLSRLLDCVQLLQNNSWQEDSLLVFLQNKASVMLGWLKAVTFESGDIPMVNDAAFELAPSSKELFGYADCLNLRFAEKKLKSSGYRMVREQKYELFIDIGKIGPDYIPGHAHSDTLNFILYVKQQPFIVDTGTSTYENSKIRQYERGTSAHNTVQIGKVEQSEVWHSFRVARRAYPQILTEQQGLVRASHNGYKRIGYTHIRTFCYNSQNITVEDEVLYTKQHAEKTTAYLHFHPDINMSLEKNQINYHMGFIQFENATHIQMVTFNYAAGFNKTRLAKKIIITFAKRLKTFIHIK